MLAVEVCLLAGRFGASTYNDRTEVEWPPHPGRLFAALVDAWGDADEPDAQARTDLVWLEQQAPPAIACSIGSEVAYRRVVTVFVPGNDPTALGKVAERARKSRSQDEAAARHEAEPSPRTARSAEKASKAYRAVLAAGAAADSRAPLTELEVLPEHRNRQPRHFPVVRPDDPVITFAWPDAKPDAERRARLDALLGRVGRLGHSATPVSCRVVDEAPSARLVPIAGGGQFLRVPRSGLLDRLEREYARHQGRGERRMPAVLQEYGSPRPVRSAPTSGVLAGDWVVVEIESPHLGLPRSLELTRGVQDALVAAAPDAARYLTGRFADGVGRPHVAVVPLADVGHRWATGILRGIALVLPRDVDAVDRERVGVAVRAWYAGGAALQLGDGTPVVVGQVQEVAAVGTSAVLWADVPYALRRSLWCRPARRWVSVTPVALDRHVPDPYRSTAGVEVIAQACRHAGLPAPVDIRLGTSSTVVGVPRASGRDLRRAFPPFVAAGSGQARASAHVTLTFAEEVAGPVLLGAGRYLGRGLFLPMRDEEDQ